MRGREDPTSGIEIVSAPSNESDYVVARQKYVTVGEERVVAEKSNKEIVSEVRRSLPIHYWMLQDGYSDRKPHDTWEITIGGRTTPLFNYAEGVTLREDQIQKLTVHLALFAMHFPSYDPELQAITVTDHLSVNVDKQGLFKRHAEAQPAAAMFALTPRTLEQGIYRPDLRVERLGAVVLHELAHFEMDTVLADKWPKDRVTSYAARFGRAEDIAESTVAYLLGTGNLSDAKKERLRQYDNWLSRPNMFYAHTPDFYPPEPPDVIKYYVDEHGIDGAQNQ